MELIVALATKFWQWSILIAVVIITFLINLLDKKKKNDLTFHADEMPELKPVPIKTKGKGFWKGIVMWLLSTRNWEITKDWKYRINGNEYIIPSGEWVIKEDILLNGNLTIYPGTQLKFSKDVSMIVKGKINAIGEEDKKIIFNSINSASFLLFILNFYCVNIYFVCVINSNCQ